MQSRFSRLFTGHEATSQTQIFKPESLATRQNRLERTLRLIKGTIVDHPRCPQYGGSLEEFMGSLIMPRRHDKNRPVRPARLTDGAAVVFTSQEFLSDSSQLLLMPDGGEIIYRKLSVNVDSQTMGSSPVELAGKEALAEHPHVLPTLGYCLGALSVEAAYGWHNAYRQNP